MQKLLLAQPRNMSRNQTHAPRVAAWLALGLLLTGTLATTPAHAGSTSDRFVPGTRSAYHLHYTNHAATDFNGLLQEKTPARSPGNPAQVLRTDVRAQLTAAVLDKKPGSVRIAYRLRNPTVTLNVNNKQGAADAAMIRNDLAKDIFAVLDARGRIRSLRFDPSVRPLAQGFARTLLALTQFVEPATIAAARWETREEDPSGHFVARYERERASKTRAPSLQTFRKAKLRYAGASHQPEPNEVMAAQRVVPRGSLRIGWDRNTHRVVFIKGSEAQTVTVEGKTVAQMRTQFDCHQLPSQKISPGELEAFKRASRAREKTTASVALSAFPSARERHLTVAKSTLRNDTLATLLAALAKAEQAKDPTFDPTTLALKFKALVLLHPHTCAQLQTRLNSAPPGGLTLPLLANALGAAGHGHAQTALSKALRARSNDWPAMAILLPALGMVGTPTPSTTEQLRTLAANAKNPNVASTALLCLGIAARNLSHSAPTRSARIVDWLVSRTRSASSPGATQQLLAALGNAGSTRSLSLVAGYSGHASPPLRAVATSGLRFVTSSKVDPLLCKRLSSDKDARVRLEAAFALGFRAMTSTTFQAQKTALLKDPNTDVRGAVLHTLWKERDRFPQARPLIKQVAKQDRSKDIRKEALRLLTNQATSRSASR